MTCAPVDFVIDARGLSKVYAKKYSQVAALDGVDFRIARGENVAIIGRSGSGKTTLLNLIAGLDHPTAGTLLVDGVQLDSLNRGEMAAYRLRTVGVVFQAFQLIPQRTALQNVELPLILAGVARSQRLLLAGRRLEQVGLQDRLTHYPYELSGGQQQRVALARALANDPAVLLADEPTGNLDSETAADVARLLVAVCREHEVTLVLVTHDAELAESCGCRSLRIDDGRLREGRE